MEGWESDARMGWLRSPEHWAAFDRSFRKVEHLIVDVASAERGVDAPATLMICSGDIHLSCVVGVELLQTGCANVRQATCSPLRNDLRRRDQLLMKFAITRGGLAG